MTNNAADLRRLYAGLDLQEALKRLIAFEMQLDRFAVAQLRILAAVLKLTGSIPKTAPRMYVTNTLSDPEEESGWIPAMLAPIANQRKDANKIMRDETITVVIGNPHYKEKAKGKGSLVESGAKNSKIPVPLQAFCCLGCGSTVSICGISTSTSGIGPPGRSSILVTERSRSSRRHCALSRSPDF